MNKSTILILGFAFAVLLPVVDIAMNFTHDLDRSTIFQISVSIAFLLSTLIATYISYLEDKLNKQQEQNRLANLGVSANIVHLTDAIRDRKSLFYAMNKPELYTKLGEFTLSASERLELMYLGDKPPNQLSKFTQRDEYITTLDNVIKSEKITIRRVIFYNTENKLWIRGIATKHRNKRFFSLYIVKENLTPSVSIQIIDDSKVMLINVGRNVSLDKKHIFIDAKDLNLIFHSFYGNVVQNSIPIIENGVMNEHNFNQYLK